MVDYFNREVEIGDTIIWQGSEYKSFDKAKVVGFTKQFGKNALITDAFWNKRVHTGFIIIEKANGSKFEWITK